MSKNSGKDRVGSIQKHKDSFRQIFEDSIRFRWYLLFLITAVFIFILFQSQGTTRPSYQLGDVAERNFKAPRDFFIEDPEATDASRQRAVEAVLTVYDHDAALLPTLVERVEKVFAEFSRRSVPQIEAGSAQDPAAAERVLKTADSAVLPPREIFAQKLGIEISPGAYRMLIEKRFSPKIADAIGRILTEILSRGVVTNKPILLRDADKGIVLRNVRSKVEKTVSDLNRFYDLDQARAAVRTVGERQLQQESYPLKNLVFDFSQRLIQPNITLNRAETAERKTLAAEEIKPTLYKIKSGEMLLREGDRVNDMQLLKLKALQSQSRGDKALAETAGTGLLILVLLATGSRVYMPRIGSSTSEQNRNLLFLSTVLLAAFLLAHLAIHLAEALASKAPDDLAAASLIYGTPLASGSMIIALFLGFELAIPFAAVLALCVALVFQVHYTLMLYFLISGVMAAYWIRDCRQRKVFIKAGSKLGLLNAALAGAIAIYFAPVPGTEIFWNCAFAFLGGLGAGVITAGVVPLVELAFDYTTDIKLMELANLDQPILKRLLMEAPGTYHHSVLVGSMVEAAASEIGANPLLAKVCGYYHDIGKMVKPMYFIENQRDGRNKHDKLAPSMSALILVAHVKNGTEIARRNKLGRPIVDAIQQHHGTSLITYFYDKAKQKRGENAVKIDDFRYPGPKPQTREFGLVMLADVAEAASRTLANPTPSRIQGMVQNLINKIFSDGQLDHCELTLKDLHKIANSFNKFLNAIHHHRVDYPEKRASNPEKARNGGIDRQPAKQPIDTDKENPPKSPSRLRRLGQS